MVDFDEDDWTERQVQKLVDALLKAKIGQGLGKHPEVTAEALARLSEGLPEALVCEWFSPNELQEMIDEMGTIEL